jgi:hypothetical protein
MLKGENNFFQSSAFPLLSRLAGSQFLKAKLLLKEVHKAFHGKRRK